MNDDQRQAAAFLPEDDEISLLDLLLTITENIKLLVIGPIAAGLAALGIAFLVTPVYTAKTTLLPPVTQSGGNAAALLSQFGGLAGALGGPMAGNAARHMAYLNSDSVRDEIIQKFNLQKRWEHDYITQTRRALQDKVKVQDDKKTGIVTIEFTDEDPKFAAELVNAYVATLSKIMGDAASEEAKKKREFLEGQIAEALRKPYQSPIIRDAVIQSLIQQFESTRLAEKDLDPIFTQVDVAKPPELKSGPKRALIAVITSLATGFALLLFVFVRQAMRNAAHDQESADKLGRISSALKALIPFRKRNP